MSRSVWKPICFDTDFEQQIEQEKENLFLARNILVTKEILGQTVLVYNGQRFVSLTIETEHLGLKAGDFSLTRAKPQGIRKKLIKK